MSSKVKSEPLVIEVLPLADIKVYERNPRIIKQEAITAVAESIKEFGTTSPILLDKDNVIIAGHTRYQAALSLGLKDFPCTRAAHLTEEQVRALRIIDNKSGEKSQWDYELLQIEMTPFDLSMPLWAANYSKLEIDAVMQAEWHPIIGDNSTEASTAGGRKKKAVETESNGPITDATPDSNGGLVIVLNAAQAKLFLEAKAIARELDPNLMDGEVVALIAEEWAHGK